MLAYFITNLILLLVSAISNIIYIANNNTENKGAAIVGLILFFGMICWTVVLMV